MSARILIVDDEEIVIRSCLRILDGDEFQVEAVQRRPRGAAEDRGKSLTT